MDQTAPAPTTCPICSSTLELRVNPHNRGKFMGCTGFIHGCTVNWSFSSRSFHGMSSIVAPASGRRSRCVSKREETIAILVAQKGFSRDEAIEFLDGYGLDEVLKAIAA